MEHATDAARLTWDKVFRQVPVRYYDNGEPIIAPGERSERLYFLETGRLRCTVATPGRCLKAVHYVWPGDIFGQPQLFSRERPVPLQVSSIGRSAVRAIGWPEARHILMMNPHLGDELMVSLASVTVSIIEHACCLSLLSVEERVADFLHRLYRREPSKEQATLKVTHGEIAEYVGAHRVSVTEALHELESRGVIETGRGRIRVKDAALLQTAAAAR